MIASIDNLEYYLDNLDNCVQVQCGIQDGSSTYIYERIVGFWCDGAVT